jgi:hypothetical protein
MIPRRDPAPSSLVLLALSVLLLVATPRARACAQDVETARGPGGPRTVAGRIVRPAPSGEAGVPGVMVTLHRVGPERSGPIDSVRTGADGRYAFRYQPTGSDDALYFVSASFGGIAYFGTPLREVAVTGDDAIVTVFDTTSGAVPLRVNGRHLIISSSDPSERRAVVEVFELSNDSSVTRVGGRSDSATFRIPLPPGARDFEAGRQGDVAPEAIAMVGGVAEVYAPFAPGIKQLSFSYTLPRDAFPLAVPQPVPTELLEVLLEDSSGTAEGAKLVRQGPVESSGRHFVRWLAEQVPAGEEVRVSFPDAPGAPRIPQYVVAAAAVAALLLFAMRMVAGRRAAAPASAESLDPDRLAQRIAALDAAHDRRRLTARALGRDVDVAEQATYDAERTRLKGELTDALARRDARR